MKKIISLVLALVMAFSLCGCNMSDYKKAQKAYESGDYENASTMFETLGDYKESHSFYNKSQGAIYDQKIDAFINDWSGDISDAEVLYADYNNLSDEIKAEMSFCEDFESAFPAYLVDYVSTLKNDEVEEIKRIIREYSECMSEEQSVSCLICLGRWDAVEKAEDFLKENLKNPHSYSRYSGRVSTPVEHSDYAYCTMYVELEYGATNSYGAEVESTDEIYIWFSYDTTSEAVTYGYIGFDENARDKSTPGAEPASADTIVKTVDDYLTYFSMFIGLATLNADSDEARKWLSIDKPKADELENLGDGAWYYSSQADALKCALCVSTLTDDINSELIGVGIQIPCDEFEESDKMVAILTTTMGMIQCYDLSFTGEDSARLLQQLLEGTPLISHGIRWKYDIVGFRGETVAYFSGELVDNPINKP